VELALSSSVVWLVVIGVLAVAAALIVWSDERRDS
jgi:hypothetical protein